MHMLRLVSVFFLLSTTIVIGVTARADALCGDANDDTEVSVTDGVLILRAAAELSSPCTATPTPCDLDANGRITITDGVRTLRLAADLPVAVTCNPVDADVQAVVDGVMPFLVIALGDLARAVGAGGNATTAATTTSPCPLGGTIGTESSEESIRLTLDACIDGRARLGNFQLDGTIDIVFASVEGTFDLSVEALVDGNTTKFTGTVPGRPRATGGLSFNGGSLVMTTPQGNFDLSFNMLGLDAQGDLVEGSCRVEDQAGTLAITSVTLTVQSAFVARVDALFDDDRTVSALLNLKTGELTEVSPSAIGALEWAVGVEAFRPQLTP